MEGARYLRRVKMVIENAKDLQRNIAVAPSVRHKFGTHNWAFQKEASVASDILALEFTIDGDGYLTPAGKTAMKALHMKLLATGLEDDARYNCDVASLHFDTPKFCEGLSSCEVCRAGLTAPELVLALTEAGIA